jgi:hypothetical protein
VLDPDRLNLIYFEKYEELAELDKSSETPASRLLKKETSLA